MKNIIIYLLLILPSLLNAQLQKQNSLNYKNIIIISDLSSRINNQKFPLKDNVEIYKIIRYFKDECVKPGQKLGDMSSLSFHTFTDAPPFTIDLSQFETIGERQQFINSTSKFKGIGLFEKLEEFKKNVKHIYNTISNPGLDLISILIEKIQNKFDIKNSIILNSQGKRLTINYDNHIYVLTDGYLEYLNQGNRQFYFGDREIKKIRKYCIDNRVNVETALNRNSNLGLPAIIDTRNKLINLHILETHERDKNIQFLTFNNPLGLRDNEILKAVWQKWAILSGFKSFEWRKY